MPRPFTAALPPRDGLLRLLRDLMDAAEQSRGEDDSAELYAALQGPARGPLDSLADES
jgi:hypothetical protein